MIPKAEAFANTIIDESTDDFLEPKEVVPSKNKQRWPRRRRDPPFRPRCRRRRHPIHRR